MLPESGIWQLHSPWTGIKTREVKQWRLTSILHRKNMSRGPWAKPSQLDWTMFWSANWNCMKLDISAEPHWYICLSCYDPSMWNLPVGSDTSASPHMSRSNLVFSVPLHCLRGRWSGLERLFLEWLLPFLSSSLHLPNSLFIDSKISEEAANGVQKSSDMLASICCLTLAYTFLFILVFGSLSHSSLKSSSALLWANVKNLTQQRGNSRLSLCCPFYWLAPCSQRSQSSSSTLRFNPSIDCDVKMKKKSSWRFSLGDWILFFIVDEGFTFRFSVITELNLAHFVRIASAFSITITYFWYRSSVTF